LAGQPAPDARESADASGLDTELRAEADESFLHKADKVDRAEAAAVRIMQAAQVENGVADELAKAVVRNVPPRLMS